MAIYINKKDQERMAQILHEYWTAKDRLAGEQIEEPYYIRHSNRLMNEFYKYTDKIIIGVINSPQYAYYRFAEVDDMMNYARMKIFESIENRQWDPQRGNIFNFFTTVTARNLRSYTLNVTKKKNRLVDFDMSKTINDSRFIYNEDYDKNFNIEFIFEEMEQFFSDKKKLLKLLEVFKTYYHMNVGNKFIKKNFIDFAKSHCFSRSFVNTFFSHCGRINSVTTLMKELEAEKSEQTTSV